MAPTFLVSIASTSGGRYCLSRLWRGGKLDTEGAGLVKRGAISLRGSRIAERNIC